MTFRKTGSPHRPSSDQPAADSHYDYECGHCGHRFISRSSTCPSCGSFAKSEGEMTKKVLDGDDTDLKKAF
jgi:rubrerythrin